MDTGRGDFAEISEDRYGELVEKEIVGVFRVGEVLKIKGSKFMVQKITPKTMKLLLMKSNGGGE